MSKYLWILDAGHGVNTPGKRSPQYNGTTYMYEYEFNISVVKLIAEKLRKLDIDFVLLREAYEVTDLPLAERKSRANTHNRKSGGRGILISVHANAHQPEKELKWTSAVGIEVFTTKGQTMSDKVAEAFMIAVQEAGLKTPSRIDVSDGDLDKEADFYILKKVVCPAILTECGFMTNFEECTKLKTKEYRDKLAQVYVDTIIKIESGELQ